MTSSIYCVVVTYNRAALLIECINALLAQTQPVAKIVIIDNASTDGTPQLLQSVGLLDNKIVEYVRLDCNKGGAGGFCEGLKRAYATGFEWVWLMDDDSIPQPDALYELLATYCRFDKARRPKLLASKVIWLDGSLHPINIAQPKTSQPEDAFLAAQHGTLSIRYATFVSLLLHCSLIEQYGLPVADYFIWADDIEYTARILKHELGVAVPSSVVLHKTAKKHTHMAEAGPRYYYHIRNNIWMLLHSKAWSRNEKIKRAVRIFQEGVIYLIASKFKWQKIRPLVLGVKDGFFTRPKS